MRFHFWPILPLLGLTAGLGTAASAQDAASGGTPTQPAIAAPDAARPPINADRPGFTNGSDTVDPGQIVVETGATQTRNQDGSVTDDYPEAEIRLGVGPDLEAEVFLPNDFKTHGGSKGFGDAVIGGKWRFYKSKNGAVRLSAAPYLSIPTRGAFGTGRVDPSLILGAETSSGSRWDVQGNLDLSDPTQSDGSRLFTVTPAAAVAYTLTPALTVFGDAYDIVPRRGPSAPTTDGGLMFLLTNDIQLDAEVGAGLGGGAATRFFGGGVSFRF